MSQALDNITPVRIAAPTLSNIGAGIFAALGGIATIWGGPGRETQGAIIFCFCFAAALAFHAIIVGIGHRLELRLIELQMARAAAPLARTAPHGETSQATKPFTQRTA